MDKKTQATPPIWLLFLLAGFPQFSETLYSPALPDIAQSLQTSGQLVQWTLSIYFIGFAAGVFTWGRCSDRMGRQPTMLFGISVYIVGSILCLIANSIEWLLLARLVQGFGASVGSVLTQTIARESLHGEKRHRFFSSVGFVIALSIALGPFIGGYLIQWFNWQANFILLVVLGLAMLLFASRYLQETQTQVTPQKIKIITVFKPLFKDPYVLACIWLVAAANGTLFSYYAESPFIFINTLKLTGSQYGWLSTAIAMAALLGSLTSRALIKYYSANRLIFIGCLMTLISTLSLLVIVLTGTITTNHKLLSVILIMLPMMATIFAYFGFIIPMTLSSALQNHQTALGTAGALFGLAYYIITAILTLIMGFIHNGTTLPMPVYFFILSVVNLVIFFGLMKQSKQ